MRDIVAQTTMFSGSYAQEDITFLLKPVMMDPTDVGEKEKLIQSKRKHYSEMISREVAPTPEYESIFETALENGAIRMGRDVASLAQSIAKSIDGPITLLSLVRAGVPLGVLLRRALRYLGADVAHFGVSIIRDRGIDLVALEYVASVRPSKGAVFVDGWTGKGAITGELERCLTGHPEFSPRLVVAADPAGRAWMAASGDDWLIPSGILGATVSGLISRTILNESVVGPSDFHGCVMWEHLCHCDHSRDYIERIWPYVRSELGFAQDAKWSDVDRDRFASGACRAIAAISRHANVTDINRIKPGIAEATRAILRRVPERVFVSDSCDPDLSALVYLAGKAKVPVEVFADGVWPYRAVTVIKAVA